MKHSPGPWAPSRQKPWVIRDADKEDVAVVTSAPCSDANERLIAAAPTLLALLLRASEMSSDEYPADWLCDVHDALEAIGAYERPKAPDWLSR